MKAIAAKPRRSPVKLAFWHAYSDGGFMARIDGLRLPSVANLREHWAVKHRRNTAQQLFVRRALAGMQLVRFFKLPLRVTLIRTGPRRLDSDNCAGACKAVRDEIACALCIDDGNECVEWRYRQEKGNYGLVIQIEQAAKELQQCST